MKVHGAACLLLLLLACSCERINASTHVEPKDLPPEVAESFRERWPDARIESASRVYSSESWGDYKLNFTSPGGWRGTEVLSKAGEIKQSFGYPARERS